MTVDCDVCVFCFKARGNAAPSCTYGMHHEFPATDVAAKPKQQHKSSKSLCVKCGLHPKNPLAQTNGCEHAYQE